MAKSPNQYAIEHFSDQRNAGKSQRKMIQFLAMWSSPPLPTVLTTLELLFFVLLAKPKIQKPICKNLAKHIYNPNEAKNKEILRKPPISLKRTKIKAFPSLKSQNL